MTMPLSQLTQNITRQVTELLGPPASIGKLTQALRLLTKWRTVVLENSLVQNDGEIVQSGTFKGMVYTGFVTV